ncbi:MAG: ATP-binding protein [Prevotellaceae bacterium]|jgi:predicted AAA+ superfamily ATPase|nr:ATP-binding protein [Prevotellaceae bacterium]
MFTQSQISQTIDLQQEGFWASGNELKREILPTIPVINSYATIITGLRRCGKSTLLKQLLNDNTENTLCLNFEDIRLAGFTVQDFIRLHDEIRHRKSKVLYFDEIQLVKKWEIFVHQLLREGYQVFITGSNSSMLSRELGSHLTGRHLSVELFPFSYNEFLQFKSLYRDAVTLTEYMNTGGIPEYVKSGAGMLLTRLLDDILIRDVVTRYGVRDITSLRQLAVYLMSHVGCQVSATRLAGLYGIKSPATLLEYFSYLKDAYLIEMMPQFSYSMKAQARNPKKIYAIDTGMAREVSAAFSENIGHLLENLVYLHLRRSYSDIHYFKEKQECDFVVSEKGKVKQLVQVCSALADLNWEREYEGLLAAMQHFKLKQGTIVTLTQSDKFTKNGLTIRLVPADEWMK